MQFLKEELTITDGYNSRQNNLHHNSDRYISVQDLWFMWKRSEVWTVYRYWYYTPSARLGNAAALCFAV